MIGTEKGAADSWFLAPAVYLKRSRRSEPDGSEQQSQTNRSGRFTAITGITGAAYSACRQENVKPGQKRFFVAAEARHGNMHRLRSNQWLGYRELSYSRLRGGAHGHGPDPPGDPNPGLRNWRHSGRGYCLPVFKGSSCDLGSRTCRGPRE